MLTDFRNSIAFRTVSRLRSSAPLKTRIGHWRKHDDRKSPKHSTENLSKCHSIRYISHGPHGPAWDRTRASTVSGLQLTPESQHGSQLEELGGGQMKVDLSREVGDENTSVPRAGL
jgi:hypothetical protein